MKKLKELIKRLILKHQYSNDTFICYLREKGVTVGESTKFFSPSSTVVDITRPYLLRIGSFCKITAGVTILTHDFSYSVFRRVYNSIQNECSGQTVIGDNCFIGMNSIIMPGVCLGDNVVVGAGSVVTKNFPSNLVVAGIPAKVICTLDEFFLHRKQRQIKDACLLASIIREEYNRDPTILEMGSFYPLFLEREQGILQRLGIKTSISGDIEEEIVNDFYNSEPVFKGFQEFIDYSKIIKNEDTVFL